MDIILYAIPVFFLLIAIELVYDHKKATGYYRVNDALTSLATGTINQLVSVIQTLIPLTLYVILFDAIALWQWPDSAILTPLVWLLAFILYDFCYYWNHRLGHEMNLLWAAHVVHHSSEEYNLTTALRQTGTGFLSFIFYLPLAILGFDPLMIISIGALNLVYQFWVHTRHIGKLGWFDFVFLSPSNHRVHHAQNKVYIDRNYGGVFVLWDRLFGTFQEELEQQPVIFGIRGALKSWNPLWANVHIYTQLCMDAFHTKNWWHKLTIWFRRTGWRPPDVEANYPLLKTDLNDVQKFDVAIPNSLKLYCIIHYVITSLIALSFSLGAHTLQLNDRIALVSFVLISCFSIGALMEHKHYAGMLEWLRIGVLLIGLATFSPISQSLSLGICLACLISTAMLWRARRWSSRYPDYNAAADS